MKIISLFIKIFNEFYCSILSLFLFLLLKPLILISSTILSKKKVEFICFNLIKFVNILFFINKKNSLRNNELKYDVRIYRDTSDRNGLNLYFKGDHPNKIITNKKILDIGCGVGGKDFEFIKFNPQKVVGIDLSSRNIEYAKELINEFNKNKLFFYHKDLFSLNEKFDTIISFTVFEHIDRNLLLPILNKTYDLLNNKGMMIIVFNHYNDKFGAHLKEYIYHPWPQILFREDILFKFWNDRFKKDKNIDKDSYFPIEYLHGVNKHNSDCFMNLNKVSITEFEKIINQSKLKLIKKYFYSKSFLLKIFQFLPKKYLMGSVVYYLRKQK